LRQFRLKSDPTIIIPASKNIWKIGEQAAPISDRIFRSNPVSKSLSFT
jgi:hypothetical protein